PAVASAATAGLALLHVVVDGRRGPLGAAQDLHRGAAGAAVAGEGGGEAQRGDQGGQEAVAGVGVARLLGLGEAPAEAGYEVRVEREAAVGREEDTDAAGLPAEIGALVEGGPVGVLHVEAEVGRRAPDADARFGGLALEQGA